MNEQQVAILIALANGHDQRHGTDDIKVRAWFSLFQQEAPDMTLPWAEVEVNRHYGLSTDMLMPAHLVARWKARKRYVQDRYALPRNSGTPMPEWFKEATKDIRR